MNGDDQQLIFSPSDFVGYVNQTLEFAYPLVVVEGELSNYRVAKNRWLYFDLKDDNASVAFFGTIYNLPGPLEDGLLVRVIGAPRLHPRFGFSVNVQTITPVGEGSLKKAAELVRRKLAAEGLFELDRKRPLPFLPANIGLITAAGSAAETDFIKILGQRFGGISIKVYDSLMQGDGAPEAVVAAINHFNAIPVSIPEVLVITRGGGSADDLAAFNDERVVRAVALSRIPTLVAIGHEIDVSLAELAADQRASTPTHAAQMIVPDKESEISELSHHRSNIHNSVLSLCNYLSQSLIQNKISLGNDIVRLIDEKQQNLYWAAKILASNNPAQILKKGYSIVRLRGKVVRTASLLGSGDEVEIQLHDGIKTAQITGKGSGRGKG